jgi:hypothetical protein
MIQLPFQKARICGKRHTILDQNINLSYPVWHILTIGISLKNKKAFSAN